MTNANKPAAKMLMSGINVRIERHLVGIRKAHGPERLKKGAELMGQMLIINESFEVAFLELRLLLELRARPREDNCADAR